MQEHDCPICYDAITAATGEVRMSCTHTFHLSCIGTWLQAGNHNCPYCRTDLQETERLTAPAVAPADPVVAGILDNIANYMNNLVYYNIAADVVPNANQTMINVAYLNNNWAQQNLFNDQLNQQNLFNDQLNQQELADQNWINNQAPNDNQENPNNRNWINDQMNLINQNWVNNIPPPQQIQG